MKTKHQLSQLSPHLFWDVNVAAMSFEKSQEQIIYKVVEFGLLSDWKIIKEVYGLETIKKVTLQLRSLDVVTLSYLSNLFKLEKSAFRCYKLTQSNQDFWNS